MKLFDCFMNLWTNRLNITKTQVVISSQSLSLVTVKTWDSSVDWSLSTTAPLQATSHKVIRTVMLRLCSKTATAGVAKVSLQLPYCSTWVCSTYFLVEWTLLCLLLISQQICSPIQCKNCILTIFNLFCCLHILYLITSNF